MSSTLPTPALVSSRALTTRPDDPLTPDQERRMRAPIVAGGITVLVFVVGFLVYAALFSISGGVPAPGVVVVENNRKTVEHLDGGVIRQIRVRDGELVKKGQPLFILEDTQARAQVEVLASQHYSLLAQKARLEAELSDRPEILFPAELTSRTGDPQVAALIRDQNVLFRASRGVYTSQVGVLGQRSQQLASKSRGLRAQVTSVDSQRRLVQDELSGVNSLYERGFAPRSRVLALQRSQAQLVGDKGAREADLASTAQQVGETRLQLAQLRQQRATQAADTLRQVQVQMADILPRLRAAQSVLNRTVVRSPAEGYVLGMTQFTEGGVARPGERLLDVVPQNSALVVRVNVRPDHINEIKLGMKAQVRLTTALARNAKPLNAKVTNVAADRITNDKGESYFTAELAADPAELKRLANIKLQPGMPAEAMIVTGERSILQYLIDPLTETLDAALHER